MTQISPHHPFLSFGLESWRDIWTHESYVLRESRVPAELPEDDLFAGLT